MDPIQKELLFKSWSKVNEITLIKVVASRGQDVDHCLEFLSNKKNIPFADAFELFHEVVDTYVYRLLSDNSLQIAQQVLQNVSRDYKSIFYQFALESTDNTVRNSIFDFLKNDNFENEKHEYKFYLDILKEIKKEPKLCNPIKRKLKIFNLENLFKQDKKFRNNLVIRLYFFNQNDALLDFIEKKYFWEYLIYENMKSELIVWCKIQKGEISELKCGLHKKYFEWKIENEMFLYGLKHLKSSDEELRYLFLCYGFVFDDEKNDAKKLSERIFRTMYNQALDKNINIGERSSIAVHLVQNNCLIMLLSKFIQIEDIESLKSSYPDKIELFNFIISLKSFDGPTSVNYLKISQALIKYLETKNENFLENNPLYALAEFLVAGKEIKTLKDDNSKVGCIIKSIPIIDDLIKRLHGERPNINAIELFKNDTGINLQQMGIKDFGQESASFSNPKMVAKYGIKFELNYTHFIRQERSSYAVYYYLLEQLTKYGTINQSQFHCAVETVTNIALSDYRNLNLTKHCVIFIEQLGFNSQNLRCLLIALRLCHDEELKSLDYKKIIEKAEEKLLGNDDNIEKIYKSNNFPIEHYTALIRVVRFSGNKYWPQKYLNFLAEKDDWFKLLLFLQHFDIPLIIIKNVCKNFKTPIIADNFYRAVSCESGDDVKPKPDDDVKPRRSFKRSRSQTYKSENQQANYKIPSQSTKSNSLFYKSFYENELQNKCLEGYDDIFALIILSSTNIPEEKIISFEHFIELMTDTNSYSTSINLMKRSIKHELPILSVLSAEAHPENVDWCWLVWLCTSMDTLILKLTLTSSEQIKSVSIFLIEYAVKRHYIQTLYRSFFIFYKNSIIFLLKFLELTEDYKFEEESTDQLRSYFTSWNNDEISLPRTQLSKEESMIFTIRILLLHVKYNYRSQYYQMKCLEIIVETISAEFNTILDFQLLLQIFKLIMGTKFDLDFESIMPSSWKSPMNVFKEYKSILDRLLESKEFDKAIELAYILEIYLDKPISNIIFTKWVTELDLKDTKFDFHSYEEDAKEHFLSAEFLVNFYLYAAIQFSDSDFNRYLWYKNALEVIKKNKLFPNESFDRDQIEFDMIMVYLKNDKSIEDIDIFHSEYYEEILSKERYVLYKSLAELKELAGIQQLTTFLKTPLTSEMKLKLKNLIDNLLDKSDIIEALRLQTMFEYQTIDLNYLVFCMSLAEGLTTVHSLTDEERCLFTKSTAVFSKRTLEERKINLEFEEIPSKEKYEILDNLQGITINLKHGTNIGKRILVVYRIAMYLDKEYTDILRTKYTSPLLVSATSNNCLKKLLVVNDIFTSFQQTAEEIAEYLSREITTSIVRPVFYLLTTDQKNIRQLKRSILWSYDLENEFHLILEICPKSSLLGEYLLKYCDILDVYRCYQNSGDYELSLIFSSFCRIVETYGRPNEPSTSNASPQVLSYKKRNTIYVELLIIAYKCFVHECHIEGMINVLNRTQILTAQLVNAKSWKLICRMLTGIEQYREMSYCFETLIEHGEFEVLLGTQYDKEKSQGLKYAILSYLREFHPNPQEYIKLVAIRFSMHTEIAEIWLNEANLKLSQVLVKYQVIETEKKENIFSKKLKCCSESIKEIEEIRDYFAQAAENYLFDEKLRCARKTAQTAQLLALQLGILNHNLSLCQFRNASNNLCLSIIDVKSREEFRELVNHNLNRCFQAIILSNSYPEYQIQWYEVLLWQYVILNNENYLQEFSNHFQLTDAIIENIVKSYQNYCKSNPNTSKMDENLKNLVKEVKSITLKYRLASHMTFKEIIIDMLNDDNSIYYLKDTNYGKKEISDDG